MQSIELIRENLIKSEERVLAKVEEMRDHAVVFPTPRGGCHTLWLLGHLAYIEATIVHHLMLGEPNPLAEHESLFDGEEVSADVDDYPPFDEVLAMLRSRRRDTLTVLDGLSEADLDEPSRNCPEGWEEFFGTYRQCLQFVADHTYMHRGQLVDARRAAGLGRIWV